MPPFHELLHSVLHPIAALIPPEVHEVLHALLQGGTGM